MSFLINKPLADKLEFTEYDFIVFLKDGRKLSVPLVWFNHLAHATIEQLQNHIIMGDGEGVHFPKIDEDISISQLFSGNTQIVA